LHVRQWQYCNLKKREIPSPERRFPPPWTIEELNDA